MMTRSGSAVAQGWSDVKIKYRIAHIPIFTFLCAKFRQLQLGKNVFTPILGRTTGIKLKLMGLDIGQKYLVFSVDKIKMINVFIWAASKLVIEIWIELTFIDIFR